MATTRTRFALLILGIAAVAILGIYLASGSGGGSPAGGPDPGAAGTQEKKPAEQARAESAAVAASAPAAARSQAVASGPVYPEAYAKALSGLIGRVVEPDGGPVPGASVELLGGLVEFFSLDIDQLIFDPEAFDIQITQQKRSTDAQGRFRFEKVDARGYYLLGVNLGKGRPQLRFVDRAPAPGETVDMGDIALDPPLALVGRVVDDRGRAVAGARIRATTLPAIVFQAGVAHVQPGTALLVRAGDKKDAPKIFWKLPRWTDQLFEKLPTPAATSAPDGSFRLEGAPAGTLTVVVDGSSIAPFYMGPVPPTKASEKNLGDLTVSRGEAVPIEVVDEQDKPVANAEVMVGIPSPMAAEYVAFLRKPIVCNAAGTVEAQAVAASKIVLVARAPGMLDWTAGDLSEVTGDPIKIKIPAPRSILVKVQDSAGKPLDARIAVQREIEGLSLLPQIEPPFTAKPERVDAGSFRVRGLKNGKYLAYARSDGYTIGKEKIEIAGDSEPTCTVTLEPEFQMEVTVLGKENGNPVPVEMASVFGAPEKNLDKLGFMALGNSKTNAQGIAKLRALGTGNYHIVATHPAYAAGMIETQLPGPKSATIQLLVGGTIEGQAVRGDQPPEKPMMVIAAPNGGETPQLPRTSVTDLEGKFHFTHLHPGRYKVVVTPRFLGESLTKLNPMELMQMARENAEQDCEVLDEQITKLTLDLNKGGRKDRPDDGFLRGSAMINGIPADGDFVMAMGAEWVRPKKIEGGGAFDLGRTRAGEYTLSLTRGAGFGGALATRQVTVKAGESVFVDFNIRTATLKGKVVSDANKPIAGARVRLNARGTQRGFGGGQRATADASGKFAFDEISEGSYGVTASYEDLISTDTPVEVSGTRSNDVVIVLRPGNEVEGIFEAANSPKDTRWAWMQFIPKKREGDPAGASTDRFDTNVDVEKRTFRARRLPAGSYQISLRLFGGEGGPKVYKSIDFDVPTGGARGVILKFEERPPGEKDENNPFGSR